MTTAPYLVHLDDADLMHRIAGKDPRALDELYGRYHQRVHRLAQWVCHDPGSVEAAVQDTFLSIWRAPTYDPLLGEPGAWIMRIARNRALDTVRRSRRHSDRRASAEVLEGVPDGADTLAAVIADERRSDVHRHLQDLPAAQLEVLELTYFAGLTMSEVALRLELPLGTVKSRTRLALDKLRVSYHAERSVPPAPDA